MQTVQVSRHVGYRGDVRRFFDTDLSKPKSFCTKEEILLNTHSVESSDHTEISRILCFSHEQLGMKNTV